MSPELPYSDLDMVESRAESDTGDGGVSSVLAPTEMPLMR